MSAKLGMLCKLYRQTTGTRAAWPGAGPAPNLSEVGNVRDLTLNLSTGEADVTTRQNNGWKAFLATLKEASVEFEMIYNPSDEAFAAIQAAFLGNTSVAFAALTGDSNTSNVEGLWADFTILDFSMDQPLEDATKVKVTMKPTYSAVAPEWVKVVED